MDANKMHQEKTRAKQHKNVISYFEKILEETPNVTLTVWLLMSHLKNHPNKMNKTYGIPLEKQGQTHKRCSSMDPYMATYLPSQKTNKIYGTLLENQG